MSAWAIPGFFARDRLVPSRAATDAGLGKSLSRVLKVSASVVVLTAVVMPLSFPTANAVLLIHAFFLLVLCASALFLRAGHRRTAGALLAGGFWLVSTAAVFAFGGVHSPGLYIYLPVVTTAALFWSRRSAAVLAVASAVVVLFAAQLEAIGALPAPLARLPPQRMWSVFTGSLVMTAVLALSALGRLRALRRELSQSMTLLEDLSTMQAAAESERRELEQRLMNMERLETMGRIAGGVAHDFNNLLSVILNSATILRRELPRESLEADLVGEIDEATKRATELVRKLLMSSSKSARTPVPVDLNALVAGLSFMLKRLAGPRTELVLAARAENAIVQADASDLEQVILNLALNARDAMPRGGRLSIETRSVAPPEAPEPANGNGSYVALVVADQGVGMDSTTASRIFEPFFTTKGSTGGTGVGLANVKRIVDESGGRIRIETSPGAGTRFEVLLPRADAA